MITRRLTRAGIVLAGLFFISGCSWLPWHKAPKADAAAQPPEAKPVVTASGAGVDQHTPSDADAEAAKNASLEGSAEALARKTSSHVQSMEPLLTKRPATPSAAAPVASTDPAPSLVKWADPDEMRLSATPVSDASPKSQTIITDATPTASAPSAPAPAVTAKQPAVESAPATANQVASVAPEPKSVAPIVAPPAPAKAAAPSAPTPIKAAAVVSPSPAMSSDELEQKLAQRVKDNPKDVAAHLDQQLLLFLRDESVPQIQAFAPLPTEDREMLSAMLDGLSNFRNANRSDANMLLSKKIKPLLEMSDRLRSQAELTIPTITLCRKVDGFGVYDPIDPPRFPAGKEHPVIVYCEVENFASQLNDKKLWETRLSQEVALFFDTEAGMEVWRDKPKTIVDQSRNRRRDFFVVKMFKIPANLTIGRYLLKVSIVDDQVKRIAEATLPVLVVAE